MASFGSFTGVSPSSTGQGPPHNPNKDIEITSPPSDSISSLTWSPAANLLVASSWDNQVRCWEVAQNGQSAPKAVTAHDQPVLCTAWSPDGTTVFSGRGPSQFPLHTIALLETVLKHHLALLLLNECAMGCMFQYNVLGNAFTVSDHLVFAMTGSPEFINDNPQAFLSGRKVSELPL
jgi:WD40 repeat protein